MVDTFNYEAAVGSVDTKCRGDSNFVCILHATTAGYIKNTKYFKRDAATETRWLPLL